MLIHPITYFSHIASPCRGSSSKYFSLVFSTDIATAAGREINVGCPTPSSCFLDPHKFRNKSPGLASFENLSAHAVRASVVKSGNVIAPFLCGSSVLRYSFWNDSGLCISRCRVAAQRRIRGHDIILRQAVQVMFWARKRRWTLRERTCRTTLTLTSFLHSIHGCTMG